MRPSPEESRFVDLRLLAIAVLAILAPPTILRADPPPAAVQPNPWWSAWYASPLVRLPEGRRLKLYCVGRGSPTVVFESGLGSGASAWRLVQPEVAKVTRTCSYDRAGLGGSDPAPPPRDLNALTTDLSQLLKASGEHGPFVLVGHSLGGQIVRQYAYLHPRAVVGLVLLDPTADHQLERITAIFPGFKALQAQGLAQDQRCLALAEHGALDTGSKEGTDCLDPAPADLPPSLGSYFDRYARSPVHRAAEVAEMEGFLGPNSNEADAARHALGAVPLVVLTADGTAKNPALTPARQAAAADLWWRLHEEIARLSTRGENRLVHSSHDVESEQPGAVVQVVKQLVAEARSLSADLELP